MNASPDAIMVGVDGSADSDRAVEWAAAAASQRQAALHFVYAIPRRHSPSHIRLRMNANTKSSPNE
jgi:nucleotide-binding universal stress UspA family protein